MKDVMFRRLQAASIAIAALGSGVTGAAAQDIDLDFHFLKFGLSRKAVVAMLGTPDATAEWRTLAIKHYRLVWLSPEGGRYSASFFNDRLFRWKKCSAGLTDC